MINQYTLGTNTPNKMNKFQCNIFIKARVSVESRDWPIFDIKLILGVNGVDQQSTYTGQSESYLTTVQTTNTILMKGVLWSTPCDGSEFFTEFFERAKNVSVAFDVNIEVGFISEHVDDYDTNLEKSYFGVITANPKSFSLSATCIEEAINVGADQDQHMCYSHTLEKHVKKYRLN